MIFGLYVLEDKMETFPFLLVKLETVEDLGIAFYCLELSAVVRVLAEGLPLTLLDLVNVDNFSEFLQPVPHANRHLIMPLQCTMITTFGHQRVDVRLRLLLYSPLCLRPLESWLNALEDWRELLIDLNDKSIVVLAYSFELWSHNRERNVVLTWSNRASPRFIWQFTRYLGLEN
jgi:hypothetical protein